MLDTVKPRLHAWRSIIGEWSTGTLRPADLLDAAADCAGVILRAGLGDSDLADACREARVALKVADPNLLDEPAVFSAYSELTEAIDNLAPAYVCWSSAEGDGAAIGLFSSVESALEDARHGELALVAAGDEFPDTGAVLAVTDHGNVALYLRDGADWVEIWGSCKWVRGTTPLPMHGRMIPGAPGAVSICSGRGMAPAGRSTAMAITSLSRALRRLRTAAPWFCSPRIAIRSRRRAIRR